MSTITSNDVRAYIITRFNNTFLEKGLSSSDIPDQYDLLAEGITDSLGIITLISEIEEEFGLEIDFEDLDPEEMTIIGSFSRYIEAKSHGQ